MAVQNAPPLSLRWAQGQVFTDEHRFRVLVAGRRFGKSYLSCVELLRGAINNPGETFFYCAPTYRMAKDIAWKVLKKLVPKAWIKTKNETDLKLELVNGSTIELKGTENAMALRGRSLSWRTNKAGHCSFPPRMERPAGSTTFGATAKMTQPTNGSAGVTPPSKAETSQPTKLRQPALNLIRARSARNSKRPSRT